MIWLLHVHRQQNGTIITFFLANLARTASCIDMLAIAYPHSS